MKQGYDSYDEFYECRLNKPMRTEKKEMEAILGNIEKLRDLKDFDSLDMIRKLTNGLLSQDESRKEDSIRTMLVTDSLLGMNKRNVELMLEISIRLD